jgi:hypothetical protein
MFNQSVQRDIILKMQKKMILILILGIVLLFVLLVFTVLFLNKSSQKKTVAVPFPTPIPSQNYSNIPGGVAPFNQQQKKQADIGSMVGQLISTLPYQGKNFSLYYNVRKDEFYLYINPNAKQAGNSEYLDYLKKMGITDLSWLGNVFTAYIPPNTASESGFITHPY